MMFIAVSCRKCGDTTIRGDWELGCPLCGAEEKFISEIGQPIKPVEVDSELIEEEEESSDE